MRLQQHPAVPLRRTQQTEQGIVGVTFLVETTHMQGASQTISNSAKVLLDTIAGKMAVVAVPARAHRRMISDLQDPFDQR